MTLNKMQNKLNYIKRAFVVITKIEKSNTYLYIYKDIKKVFFFLQVLQSNGNDKVKTHLMMCIVTVGVLGGLDNYLDRFPSYCYKGLMV